MWDGAAGTNSGCLPAPLAGQHSGHLERRQVHNSEDTSQVVSRSQSGDGLHNGLAGNRLGVEVE